LKAWLDGQCEPDKTCNRRREKAEKSQVSGWKILLLTPSSLPAWRKGRKIELRLNGE
jgi:hypothetical protein